MKGAVRQTFGNPRWWLVLPLMLVIFPIAALISFTAWSYEWFHFNISNPLVMFLRRIDRMGTLKPLTKWIYAKYRSN